MQITVKDKSSGREITFNYNLGEVVDETGKVVPDQSLQGSANLFGVDVAWANLESELKTCVRDHVRPQLAAGVTDEDILKDLAEWKIGVRTSRAKDPVEQIMKLMGKLDPEKQAAVAALLKKKKG